MRIDVGWGARPGFSVALIAITFLVTSCERSGQTAEGTYSLGHFQVGSYRYRSLLEGLYTLQKPYGSPIYPKLPNMGQ